MNKQKKYLNFLAQKVKLAESHGFEPQSVSEQLFPHQADIVKWAIEGGRRAVFASFGLGKTLMQLETARQVIVETGKPVLIGLPLGVKGEFLADAKLLNLEPEYVTNASQVTEAKIYLSNYERIRDGNFDPSVFGGVCFDEASVIRSMGTLTTQYILSNFKQVPYRFVFTATPSPNEYHELLKYADFLGIMDITQALSRFFKRDSSKAHNSSLLENMENEFWHWVSSWATFLTKPSDLGYPDTGYDLPPMKVHYHRVSVNDRGQTIDRDGNLKLFADAAISVQHAAKEKRVSLDSRVSKMLEIVNESPKDHFLLWHNLEDERRAIEKALPQSASVMGNLDHAIREQRLEAFKNGELQYLATKPEIAGSGCNFQYHCHKAIFLGIDYKFNDFIQAVHRIYRFQQSATVEIHIIYTDAEDQIVKKLGEKWQRHNEMVEKMTNIIKEHGLSINSLASQLKRAMGVERKVQQGKDWTFINNDAVLECQNMDENSVDMVLTSIPFSDQFEYSESYHDMGHNGGDLEFFKQLGFLTSELHRITRPGRIAAIHVKDRIRFSYESEGGFIHVDDFSGKTVAHFVEHGWYLMGKITITTDVVRENNQTYRLGWSEQCKDATKMGVGLPEYVLIFRKKPTDTGNSYADVPVVKSKEEYTRARWQLDAHSYWKSNGHRLLDQEELKKLSEEMVRIGWQIYQDINPYNFENHVDISEKLDCLNRLSSNYMSLPPESQHPDVWTDINRINTLNTAQSMGKKQKHVCPLQLDIIERLITRYTNPGESVFDPFGGIASTPVVSLKLGRKALATELNTNYWKDGVGYLTATEYKMNQPTLFS